MTTEPAGAKPAPVNLADSPDYLRLRLESAEGQISEASAKAAHFEALFKATQRAGAGVAKELQETKEKLKAAEDALARALAPKESAGADGGGK